MRTASRPQLSEGRHGFWSEISSDVKKKSVEKEKSISVESSNKSSYKSEVHEPV